MHPLPRIFLLMLSQVLLLGRGGARKNCANSWMEVHDKKGMTDGKRFHVLRVKNRFDPSLDDRPELLNGGYRDINIKLKIGFTEGKDGRAELMTVRHCSGCMRHFICFALWATRNL